MEDGVEESTAAVQRLTVCVPPLAFRPEPAQALIPLINEEKLAEPIEPRVVVSGLWFVSTRWPFA